MPGQSDEIAKGGTLRLGAYPCELIDGTRIKGLYSEMSGKSAAPGTDSGKGNKTVISERHRHRYEFNNLYRDVLREKGLILSGLSPDGKLVETVEIREHPFYIGVQFHPEFKSRPNRPHPLFKGFTEAAGNNTEKRAEYDNER